MTINSKTLLVPKITKVKIKNQKRRMLTLAIELTEIPMKFINNSISRNQNS